MKKILTFTLGVCLPSLAFANPAHFNYQGRLFDSNGAGLNSGTVTLELQVTDPSGDCLLREESHDIDMTDSEGFFSVTVGFGTPTADNPATLSFAEIFNNSTTFSDPNINCNSDTYTPAANDHRLLKVSVNGEPLNPDQVVSSVPFALQASDTITLSGNTLSDVQSYADDNLAGSPLPVPASSLGAGESFRWDGSQWQVFTPGASTSIDGVTAGDGLTGGGTTGTVTLHVAAGDGMTVNADNIAINPGNGLQINGGAGSGGALELNLGSGLQFNTGAVEVDDTQIEGFIEDGFGAMTVNVDLGNNRIVNLLDPINAQDAATKSYVDGAIGTHNHVLADITDAGSMAAEETTSYYTQSNLQTSGQSSVHFGNLTNVPSGLADGDDVGMTALTGDVTASGSGSVPTIIANNAVTPAKTDFVGTLTEGK